VKSTRTKNQKAIASSLALVFLLSFNATGAPLRMDANMSGVTYASVNPAQGNSLVEYIVNGRPAAYAAAEPGETIDSGKPAPVLPPAPSQRPAQGKPALYSGPGGDEPRNLKTAQEPAPPIEDVDGEIVMYAGEARVLDVGAINRVAIGNGKIASTTVIDNTKLLIIAQEVGLTNILIWKKPHLSKEIRLRVTALNVLKQQQDISTALSGLPNVKVVRRGERIYVEGSISSREEFATIHALTTQYANLVNNVKLDMKGVPVDKQDTQMLIFDLYFVEFKKGFLENLGVSWAKSFNGFNVGVFAEATRGRIDLRPVPPTGPTLTDLPPGRQYGINAAANAIISVPAIIKLAVDSGDAFVLASPSIATKNGGQARFVSGGEVPIPTVSQNGTNVTFKPYGVLIEIAPKLDRFGNIAGLLKAEVSNIDPSVSVNGIPGFSTRRTESDFSVRTGDAIILSGLYNQEASKDVQKVPLLGDVPLFGELFKATNRRKLETEIYMIAVPRTHEGEQFEDSKSLNALSNRLNQSRENIGIEPQPQMPSIRNIGASSK
jgi:pilus assembly protein CpaC